MRFPNLEFIGSLEFTRIVMKLYWSCYPNTTRFGYKRRRLDESFPELCPYYDQYFYESTSLMGWMDEGILQDERFPHKIKYQNYSWCGNTEWKCDWIERNDQPEGSPLTDRYGRYNNCQIQAQRFRLLQRKSGQTGGVPPLTLRHQIGRQWGQDWYLFCQINKLTICCRRSPGQHSPLILVDFSASVWVCLLSVWSRFSSTPSSSCSSMLNIW